MHTDFQQCKELEVFIDSESVKENVMLRTHSQTLANLIHIFPDVVAIDDCCTTCGRVET